jgi:hypothetical protein
MKSPDSDLGREFLVGAVLHNVAGGGHLRIAPGYLELRPGPISERVSKVEAIRHGTLDVVLYRARLLPPWMNCALVLSDGEHTGLATFAGWMKRRIAKALADAGFHVVEKLTLVERGYESMTF